MKAWILAGALCIIPAGAAEISGTWRLHGNLGDSRFQRLCTFKQGQQKIEGACMASGPMPVPRTALVGEVEGKSVTWQYESRYLGAPVVVVFKGIFESNMEIKGSVTASDAAGANLASGTFTASQQ